MYMQTQTAFANADAIDLNALLLSAQPAGSGFVAGTRVETKGGWRPVENLRQGDAVFTLDGGLRRIVTLRREVLNPARLVHVPGGALDNCADLQLLPGQHMLIETDLAEAAFGSPLVLVPAGALVGFRGIGWMRTREAVQVIAPCFEEEEVVWANTGALTHCPGTGQAGQGAAVSDFFPVAGLDQARRLVALMEDVQPFARGMAA